MKRAQAGSTLTTLNVFSARPPRLACVWPTPSTAVVIVRGEIDASNADTLTDFARAHVSRCRLLILDLAGLKFFAAEGFLALHRISVCCAQQGTGWALVPGAGVSRVLRICDPHGSLPTAGTVSAALAGVVRPISTSTASR
jgi:anti-anti-sigma factor